MFSPFLVIYFAIFRRCEANKEEREKNKENNRHAWSMAACVMSQPRGSWLPVRTTLTYCFILFLKGGGSVLKERGRELEAPQALLAARQDYPHLKKKKEKSVFVCAGVCRWGERGY